MPQDDTPPDFSKENYTKHKKCPNITSDSLGYIEFFKYIIVLLMFEKSADNGIFSLSHLPFQLILFQVVGGWGWGIKLV